MKIITASHKYISKQIFKIIDEKCITHIKKIIFDLWDIDYNGDNLFPGAQPISLERKHIPYVKNNKYMVCPKIDGERFFLLSFIFENKNITVLIDRKFSIYLVKQNWKHENSYKYGTLFDGELIKDMFIIHDIYILEGNKFLNENFDIRLKYGNIFFDKNRWSKDNENTFDIKLKKFYKLNEIKDMVDNDMNDKNISCDGIIFYPENEKVYSRQQIDLFKWKPKHTIDFKIKQCKSSTNLYIWDKGKEILYKKIVPKWDYEDESIIECEISKDGLIVPIKQRVDKNTGNSKYTLEKTLISINEDITIEELINNFQKN